MSPTPDSPDPYEACMRAAAGQGPSLARGLVSSADQSLLRAAAAAHDSTERTQLIEARDLLLRHQQFLRDTFPETLRAELTAGALRAGDSPDASSALSFDALELMAEDQVEDTIELLRAQQLVGNAVELELVQLNALMSAAQGLKVVRAAANPLRPEVWIRALAQVTRKAQVSAGVRARWMHHFSLALGAQLAAVYRVLCEQMRQEGVAAAAFAIRPAQERPASALSGAAATLTGTAPAPATHAPVSAPGPASASASGAPRVTLRELRRLMIGPGGAPAPGHTLAGQDSASHTRDPGLTVPAAFEVLQDMKRRDEVIRRMRERHAGGVWRGETVPGQEARGAAAATFTPAQTLSREVVRMMVENIASDARLLPAVQQSVRDLEPALLRLAANDPRFFSDKQHPARQLLEEMTHRSQAWTSSDLPGYAAFFTPLREVVDALAQMPVENAEPFDYALHTLRQAWSESEERTRRQRAASARALLKAEARNLLAASIAAELRARPDVAAAPLEVRRFLAGPWSQVMAAARLAEPQGGPDPGGFGAIVNDLVWTSQPRLASANLGRLATLAPPLMETLRRGLDKIDYSLELTQQFLVYLDQAHALARAPASGGAPTPIPAARPASGADAWDGDAGDAIPWLSPVEVRESSLMQSFDGTHPASQFANTQAEDTDGQAPPQQEKAPMRPEDLQPGGFVEVLVKGAWVRWRLNWVSPQTLLFMFTNGAGKSESMTRQMIDKMVSLKAMRLLPDHSVVQGALDAVAQTALRNSIEQPD